MCGESFFSEVAAITSRGGSLAVTSHPLFRKVPVGRFANRPCTDFS
jgi:hypothetical protein